MNNSHPYLTRPPLQSILRVLQGACVRMRVVRARVPEDNLWESVLSYYPGSELRSSGLAASVFTY